MDEFDQDQQEPAVRKHEWSGEYDAGVPVCANCGRPYPCPDADNPGPGDVESQGESQPGPTPPG